jgi:hypothetical protein
MRIAARLTVTNDAIAGLKPNVSISTATKGSCLFSFGESMNVNKGER